MQVSGNTERSACMANSLLTSFWLWYNGIDLRTIFQIWREGWTTKAVRQSQRSPCSICPCPDVLRPCPADVALHFALVFRRFSLEKVSMSILVCFFEWFAQQACFPPGSCTQPSREEVLVLSCLQSNMRELSARGIPPPPPVLLPLLLFRSRLSRLSYRPLILLLFLPLGLLLLLSLLPLLLLLLSAPRVFLPLHHLLIGRFLPLVLLLLPFMLLVSL